MQLICQFLQAMFLEFICELPEKFRNISCETQKLLSKKEKKKKRGKVQKEKKKPATQTWSSTSDLTYGSQARQLPYTTKLVVSVGINMKTADHVIATKVARRTKVDKRSGFLHYKEEVEFKLKEILRVSEMSHDRLLRRRLSERQRGTITGRYSVGSLL